MDNWEKYYKLKLGDTYVEAGAHQGTDGIRASEKVGPEGKVILIESSPEDFEILKELVIRHNLGNVALVSDPVWNFKMDGKKPIDDVLWESGIQYVDLLVGDIEGVEMEIIGGCREYLGGRRIRNLAIAVHRQDYMESISTYLQNFGFAKIILDYYEQGVYATLEGRV